jgi:hypothetical protein
VPKKKLMMPPREPENWGGTVLKGISDLIAMGLHAAEHKKHVNYWRVKERKDYSRQVGDETTGMSYYIQCDGEEIYISIQRVPRGE